MRVLAAAVLFALAAGARADDRGLGGLYDGSPSSEAPRFDSANPATPPGGAVSISRCSDTSRYRGFITRG